MTKTLTAFTLLLLSAAALTTVAPAAHADPSRADINRRAAEAFRKTDYDRSGTITRREFFRHYGERANKRRAFQQIDTNRTGVLSRTEWMRHAGLVYTL